MTSSPDFEDEREKRPDSDGRRSETEPLAPSLRGRVRQALGRDPGSVRIHTGPAAEADTQRLGARAVTRKEDIYFARDEFDPGTAKGKRLLLHELVHTLQQSGSGTPQGDQQALEAEAAHVAEAVASGQRASVGLRAPRGHPQRQEKGKPVVPSIQKHPEEIPPVPGQGMISAAGITIAYVYAAAKEAVFTTLTLQIPEGVAVVVSPLTDLHEGADYRAQNAGGTKGRSVVLSVSNRLAMPPKLQVTFSRGSAGTVVVFQFPSSAGKK
jgi:hypothetical protein